MSEIKKYGAIDIAKFVAAIFVICIHFPLVKQTDNLFLYYTKLVTSGSIARIAVPFFFLCGGFFLYRKTSYANFSFKPTIKYIKRIFFLYAIWSLIYLTWHIVNIINNPLSIFEYIKNFILTTDRVHLWYLKGLGIAVLLVSSLLWLKIKPQVILLISFLFYIIGLLGCGYYGVLFARYEEFWLLKWYFETFETTRNGLFFGFFFVSLGMYLAYSGINISKTKSLVLFIISLVLLITETVIIDFLGWVEMYDIQFFLIPATLFIFLFLKNIEVKDNETLNVVRKISTLMYLSHPFVAKLFWFISIPAPFSFIVFTIATIAFSYGVVRLSEKEKFKWLKTFY